MYSLRLKNQYIKGCVLAVLAFSAIPAFAHHSFAAYNMAETVSVAGTIKEFRWGAPHSSLVVFYEDADGQRSQMSIVSGSPLMFTKQGFKPRDFHRGDEVTVQYHPNSNGEPGGALSGLTLPNGQTFSDVEAAKSAPSEAK